MQENNITSMREVFEKMTTQKLDELLNSELESETPDGNTVRLILSILWEREKDMPVEITPGAEKAWAKYKKNITKLDAASERKARFRRWSLRAASVAAVLCLMVFAVPQKAGAESFFEKLARLTDSIVEFFSPGMANDNVTEYVFETDNPGLQQVYDAVVALGVTDPVVPMWLPEGYELVECKIAQTPNKVGIIATFDNNTKNIVYCVDVHSLEVAHEYHWDGQNISKYESYGGKHTVMRNNDRMVATWVTEKVECSITLDCQEDILHKILDSIYVMEDE